MHCDVEPASETPRTAVRLVSSAAPATEKVEEAIRVCFLIDRLAAAGTESQLLALIRHLDRAHVQPYLCLLDGEDAASQALEPQDCPVLRLGVRRLTQLRTIPRAWRLARFLRRERIDVVQVYFPDSTYFGTLVGRLAGVPRLVRTRNNLGYWLTPGHRWLGRLCNLVTDAIVANCIACRDAVIRDESAPGQSVVVLSNGVELGRFAEVAPVSSRSEPPRVGIVANLRPVKDLEGFVRAAAAVARLHPTATFAIAGEGEQRSSLEALVQQLELQGRCHLLGSIADTPAFLESLDVAVLCSRSEGMSNALMEYMAAGRPIVATSVGANSELIDDGVNGLLVPPGDPTRLAEAVHRLLADPALAARFGAAARRKAEQNFCLQRRARRFEAFYRGLLLSGTPGGIP
jgi:glycosyltransferase involved in cell wall biosynthesis